jgi:uncharacterized RDD family membrane protein YckC
MDQPGPQNHQRETLLARPIDRVAAALVDFVLFLPVLVFWVGLTINYVDGIKGRPEWRPAPTFWIVHLLFLLLALSPTFISAFLLARRGYSIGKRLLWIRIARLDGARIGFFRGVVLRSWLVVVLVLRPEVWLAYWLINVVLMFLRRDHRCVHDLLLGTLVVKV